MLGDELQRLPLLLVWVSNAKIGIAGLALTGATLHTILEMVRQIRMDFLG